jgi:hypothetical protein
MLREFYGENFRHFPDPSEVWKPYRANGNVPARVIKDDYMQLFNQEELISDLEHAKMGQMKLTELRYAYSTPVYQLKARLALLKMREEFKKMPENSADIIWNAVCSEPSKAQNLTSKIFGAKDSALHKAITHFTAVLFDSKYRYWKISTPIEANERMLCIGFLLSSQRPYWEIRRLLTLTDEGTDLSDNVSNEDRIQRIHIALQDIDELLLAMDEGNFSEANEILSKFEDTCSGFLELAQARMWFAARAQEKRKGCEGRHLSNWQAALLAKRFECDGDILSSYGDYLWAQGKKKKAEKFYQEARDKTSNGLTLLHIKDRLAGGNR